MAAAFISIVVFVLFQSCTCANFKIPPNPLLESAEGMKCLYEDSVYNPWQRFVNEKCTGYCTCNGRSGDVGCVSLCPPSPVPWCSQGELPETRNEPVPDILDPLGRCSCKRKSCNPRPNLPPPPPLGGSMEHHVIPECRGRVPNEWFINEKCTGRCRCRLSGIVCVSLCAQMRVKCSSDAEMETYDQPMDDVGRCTCKRERCVEKIGVWLQLWWPESGNMSWSIVFVKNEESSYN